MSGIRLGLKYIFRYALTITQRTLIGKLSCGRIGRISVDVRTGYNFDINGVQ